jgi:hypothetical protein
MQTDAGSLGTSSESNQAAIIALFRVISRYVGNLPPMPGAFPDYSAPVIRDSEGGREMVMMRWGMPPPPRTGGPPVTNISGNAGDPGDERRARRVDAGAMGRGKGATATLLDDALTTPHRASGHGL